MAVRDEEFKINDLVFGTNAATFVCSSDKIKATFLEATIVATGCCEDSDGGQAASKCTIPSVPSTPSTVDNPNVCAPGGAYSATCAPLLAAAPLPGISDGSAPYTCGLRNAYAKDLALKLVVDGARATLGGICCGGADKKSVCDIDFSSVCATGGTFNAAGAAKNTGVTVPDGVGGTRAPTCQEVMMAVRDEEFKINDMVFGTNAASFVCSSDKLKASFLEATIVVTGKKF